MVNANTDAVIGLVSDPMTVFNQPFDIAITPDGSKAYVVNQGFPPSVAVVNTLIDTATGIVVNSVLAFSNLSGIAITARWL